MQQCSQTNAVIKICHTTPPPQKIDIRTIKSCQVKYCKCSKENKQQISCRIFQSPVLVPSRRRDTERSVIWETVEKLRWTSWWRWQGMMETMIVPWLPFSPISSRRRHQYALLGSTTNTVVGLFVVLMEFSVVTGIFLRSRW